LLLVFGVAGCALKPLPAESNWQARQQLLSSLDSWDLSGRISVRTPDEAANGSLSWVQDGNRLQMGFRGPLGVGGFRLSGDDSQLLFEDSKGRQAVLDDPQSALAVELGWEIPLTSLGYWVRALPDPTMQAEQFFEPSGRLGRLQQDGWSVSYEKYAQNGPAAMPGRVTVERNGVRIRLVVDSWNLGGRP
jgi:outer membrane lipoprotein LolB